MATEPDLSVDVTPIGLSELHWDLQFEIVQNDALPENVRKLAIKVQKVLKVARKTAQERLNEFAKPIAFEWLWRNGHITEEQFQKLYKAAWKAYFEKYPDEDLNEDPNTGEADVQDREGREDVQQADAEEEAEVSVPSDEGG